jgi:hypothetical protein
MTETVPALTDDDPIAWRAIVYDTPVFAAGGEHVGTVREVLGSDAEDVFHGLRVGADDEKGDRLLLADDVSLITRSRIETGLSADEVAALKPYHEQDTYHLASVGWLRRHLGWRKDSQSDEEPG